MIHDTKLKEALFQHFWKQRCYVQPEVNVYFMQGATGPKKTITDVDVYALRPSSASLSFERVLADCKTLKGQSPINRALWLGGLLKFLGGRAGFVLLDLPSIEPDHKLAASSIDVLLLNRKDFSIYDKSVNYPEGSSTLDVHLEDVEKLRTVGTKFPKLESLTTYLYRDAWRESSFGSLIRHTLAQMRVVARELDPARIEHRALVCDAASVLSIGVAECCGLLFHQYLHPDEKDLLSESLKILIWGGREQYELNRTLRARLLAARGSAADESETLLLPEWNAFLQLARNILERPAAAFHVPWFLRQMAFDILRSRRFSGSLNQDDLLTAKYSMLVIEYLCRASGLPREFQEQCVSGVVRVQTELAEARDESRKPLTAERSVNKEAESLDPEPKTESANHERAAAKYSEKQPEFPDLKA